MTVEDVKNGFSQAVLANLEDYLTNHKGRAIGLYTPDIRTNADQAIDVVMLKAEEEFSVSFPTEKLTRLLGMLYYILDLDIGQNIPQRLHPLIILILLQSTIDASNSEQVETYKNIFFCIKDRKTGVFVNGLVNKVRWCFRYGLAYDSSAGIPNSLPAEEWIEFIKAYCAEKAKDQRKK